MLIFDGHTFLFQNLKDSLLLFSITVDFLDSIKTTELVDWLQGFLVGNLIQLALSYITMQGTLLGTAVDI